MVASSQGLQCQCLVSSATQAATLPDGMADASASLWRGLRNGAIKRTPCATLRQPICTVVQAPAVCIAGKSSTALLIALSDFYSGGGFGYVSRAYGLACDTIAEVEVVLADGTVINANANNNSDLLWASQGGLYTTESDDVCITGQSTQAPLLSGSRQSHPC